MIEMKISSVVFEMPEERTRLANMASEVDAKGKVSFEKLSLIVMFWAGLGSKPAGRAGLFGASGL